MRDLIERLRESFTPLKALMLVACAAVFLFAVGFVGYNVYHYYFTDAALTDAVSYALESTIAAKVV